MKLPDGITEEEFVKTVNIIANQLCNKFQFGYYNRDDIKQECFIEAIDALDRYDDRRPLINFLWSHIHNRLCNLKRNKYTNREKPCFNCPLNGYIEKDGTCKIYENMLDCDLYNNWFTKNNKKQNIMHPIGISYINDENEDNMKNSQDVFTNIATKEIIDIIDKNISISMRKYWLKQRSGVDISKKHYTMLLEEIQEILQENNIDVSQAW